MPECTINSEGQLLDTDGQPVMIGEEPVIVTGAKPQKDIDRILQERLARQKNLLDTLKAQVDKTPDLTAEIDTLQAEKVKTEQQLANAQEEAHNEVAQQIKQITQRAETLESDLTQERQARVSDQVTNQILANAGGRFINPGEDIVPRLLKVHKREPAQGADGKPIEGQHVDLFEVPVTTEDGKQKTDFLPVKDALTALSANPDYQHYVKGSGTQGSGGAPGAGGPSPHRSKMNTAEKAAFCSKHGADAFNKLPV